MNPEKEKEKEREQANENEITRQIRKWPDLQNSVEYELYPFAIYESGYCYTLSVVVVLMKSLSTHRYCAAITCE